MNKLWKILGIIIAAAFVLGAICVAVGMFTGADFSRIYTVFDDKYHITMYAQYVRDVIVAVSEQI